MDIFRQFDVLQILKPAPRHIWKLCFVSLKRDAVLFFREIPIFLQFDHFSKLLGKIYSRKCFRF